MRRAIGVWVTPAGFIFLGLLLYFKAFQGEFVSDDYIYIVGNPAVRDLWDWPAIWQSFNTRFLVGLSFAVNYHFGQLNVEGYHIVNLALHLLSVFQVYRLVTVLLRTPALRKTRAAGDRRLLGLAAALIFLCHPIQSQGVAFITQRAVAGATLFYLLTVRLYLQARITGTPRHLWAAALAMLAGLLTKEMTVTIPLMLTACELFFFGADDLSWRRRAGRLLPFYLLSALLPLILLMDRPTSVLALGDQVQTGRFSWPYFLTEINVLRTYLRLLLFPVHLHHEYDYMISTHFWNGPTPLSAVLLLSVAGLGAVLFRRHRLMSFAVLWFFLTISVETAVVCVVTRAVLYEHWLYLPMTGFAIFLVMGLYTFFQDTAAFRRILVVLVAVYSLMTFARMDAWRTEIGFWQNGITETPDLPNVYLGAGMAYQRQNRNREAVAYYEKGITLTRERDSKKQMNARTKAFLARIYNNLGIIYFKQWQDDKALAAYRMSEELDRTAEVIHNLGVFYYFQDRFEEAVPYFREVIMMNGESAEETRYLGFCYQKMGDCAQARPYLMSALAVHERYREDKKADQVRQALQACARP